MCGIVGGFADNISSGVNALKHRGPDANGIVQVGSISLGHTRLAIIDVDSRSNQPFMYHDVTLVYNGELWNYKELRSRLLDDGYEFNTTSDTEVLAAMLQKYNTAALPLLDGMFAFAWTIDGETLYLARDRYGEMPLHVARRIPFLFASEHKALHALDVPKQSIEDVPPGYVVTVRDGMMSSVQYYDIPISVSMDSQDIASQSLARLIDTGTKNRMIADVPICTLLSGGIDSAAITYALSQYKPDIVSYTAVYNTKSPDLKSARLLADAMGIELIEVKVPTPTTKDLSDVVRIIEMPYKAQVEIGWACLWLARAIQADGFKVVFSGEGSDELWASYGFAYHALKTEDWHYYRKKLFLSQARKNFVRCNKIFMSHSIECRLPFLHFPLVEYAISLPQKTVQGNRSELKKVLQCAYEGVLPDAITKRPKLAFQDGLGLKKTITNIVQNPRKLYTDEYKRQFT